jgi:chemotaxis protein histidine kinase CheA
MTDQPEITGAAPDRAMEDAMAGFRERARASNLKRVEVIADALNAMRGGSLDEQGRLGARGAAHTVAGSAGTFGFAEASELGRALEALLDAVRDPDPEDREDRTVRAERGLELVARLRTALLDPGVTAPVSPVGDGSP